MDNRSLKLAFKLLVAFMALAIIVSLAACGGEKTTPSAQEIVNGVIQSQEKVKTYQFDLDMTISMSGQANDERIQGNIAMDANGACDFPNKKLKMQMNMNIDLAAPEVEKQAMEMEAYIIEDTFYMLASTEGMAPQWMKSETQAELWEEQIAQVESQVELLRAADVKLLGSEKIKGVDCYVLEVTPDLQKLWETAMQQGALGMGTPQISPEAIRDILKSVSVKYWVEKDTYFLAKTDMQMKMELTPEAMGAANETGQVNMDMSMTLLAYNYNKSVSVTLPPEAQNATEMP